MLSEMKIGDKVKYVNFDPICSYLTLNKEYTLTRDYDPRDGLIFINYNDKEKDGGFFPQKFIAFKSHEELAIYTSSSGLIGSFISEEEALLYANRYFKDDIHVLLYKFIRKLEKKEQEVTTIEKKWV